MHLTTQQLTERGVSPRGVARLTAAGELVRVRRGLYSTSSPNPLDLALLLRRSPGDVLGLESAALVHGLPLLERADRTLHVMEAGDPSVKRRAQRVIHRGRLPAAHVTVVGDARVTTAARTVVDLARLRGRAAGLIPWEALLHRTASLAELEAELDEVIEAMGGSRGIAVARGLRRFACHLSESPKESQSRLVLESLGIPDPVQQFVVASATGQFLGRADFGWPHLGVLGEYDGKDKYDSLARAGQSPRDVMLEEKRRQRRMELEGWTFARWEERHLRAPQLLRDEFDAACRVAARRAMAA